VKPAADFQAKNAKDRKGAKKEQWVSSFRWNDEQVRGISAG